MWWNICASWISLLQSTTSKPGNDSPWNTAGLLQFPTWSLTKLQLRFFMVSIMVSPVWNRKGQAQRNEEGNESIDRWYGRSKLGKIISWDYMDVLTSYHQLDWPTFSERSIGVRWPAQPFWFVAMWMAYCQCKEKNGRDGGCLCSTSIKWKRWFLPTWLLQSKGWHWFVIGNILVHDDQYHNTILNRLYATWVVGVSRAATVLAAWSGTVAKGELSLAGLMSCSSNFWKQMYRSNVTKLH